MKILVTGAAGMLAAAVIKELIENGHDVIQADINQRLPIISKLDVTNLEDVLSALKTHRPDYVFHLAAETNVDLCQEKPKHAFKVNALGTKNIALACKKYNAVLIYISTASVFYGDKPSAYTELDETRPKNIYGQTKLEGELEVKKILKKYFIIRAGWMVGGWEIDKKFVYKIVQQIKSGKKEIKAVNDKFGSPTFTEDFAKNLINIINTKKYGLYHMVNRGVCSRYDIAVKIVEFMGYQKEIRVIPVSSKEFPLPAPRADSETLQNYKLGLSGLDRMPHWEKSLEEYIKANKEKL